MKNAILAKATRLIRIPDAVIVETPHEDKDDEGFPWYYVAWKGYVVAMGDFWSSTTNIWSLSAEAQLAFEWYQLSDVQRRTVNELKFTPTYGQAVKCAKLAGVWD